MFMLLLFNSCFCFFFFNDPATTEIYTLSLHDALPISASAMLTPDSCSIMPVFSWQRFVRATARSEEHTSELQSPDHLVCRLLLEKKKKNYERSIHPPNCTRISFINPV